METILTAYEYDKKKKSLNTCHIVMGSVSYLKSIGFKEITYIEKGDESREAITESKYFFDIYFNSGKVLTVCGDSFFNLFIKLRVRTDMELRDK